MSVKLSPAVPTCSLERFAVELCSLDFLLGLIRARIDSTQKVYVCRVAEPGGVNFRVLPRHVEMESEFTGVYRNVLFHQWGAEYLVLVDTPSYLLPEIGVCVAEDGQIISETLYPGMTGDHVNEWLTKNGHPPLPELIWSRVSAEFDSKVVAPVLSAWSSVYFHALSESLVVTNLISNLGLRNDCVFPIPEKLVGAQRIVPETLLGGVVRLQQPLIRVKRTLICSGLYRHAALNMLFASMIGTVRRNVMLALCNDRSDEEKALTKVFVSRGRAAARPLLNQREVEDIVSARGYNVLHPDELSFKDQVAAFSQAGVVLGAHGAGLANGAFMLPQSILFELRPLNRIGQSPMWNSSYRKISGIMGLRYGFEVFENAPETDEWTIDLVRLQRCLDHIDVCLPRDRTEESVQSGYDKLFKPGLLSARRTT